MKLKNILAILVAATTLAVACTDKEAISSISGLVVSQSYIPITAVSPASNSITIICDQNWSVDGTTVPEWLTVSPMSGSADQEVKLTFNAEENTGGERSQEVIVKIGDGTKTQILKVVQASAAAGEVEPSTCEQVIAGPDVTYRVSGVCTRIANTSYGNWYLADDTGEIYIYGTVNSKGAYPKDAAGGWEGFGIEVGDVVTVEGPKTVYNGTVELVDVSIISIKKSLVKVDPAEVNLPKEEATFQTKVVYTGDTFEFASDSEWLTVLGFTTAGDTTYVDVHATENNGAQTRTGVITFKSTTSSSSSEVGITVNQKGAVKEATVGEVAAAEDNNALYYRVQGYISGVTDMSKGRFDITDYSGTIYCYNINVSETDSSIDLSGTLAEGDVVTIVGYKTSYKGTNELCGYVESYYKVKTVTIAEFVAADDNNKVFYRISGKVTDDSKNTQFSKKFDLKTYGNFDLVDETGNVYVYGVKTGLGGESAKFGTLGVEEGDNLTIVAYKTTYKGLVEASGCWYVSHESNGGDGGDEGGESGDVLSGTHTLTDASIPTAYPTSETTFTEDGVECYILNVANYGNGIQMKKEGSYIANKTPFKKITKVVLTWKKNFYPENLKVFAGDEEKPSATEITPSTDSDTMTATFDFSGGSYKYFKVTNPSTYACYLASIVVESE